MSELNKGFHDRTSLTVIPLNTKIMINKCFSFFQNGTVPIPLAVLHNGKAISLNSIPGMLPITFRTQ